MDRKQLLAPQRPSKMVKTIRKPKSSYTDKDLEEMVDLEQECSSKTENTGSIGSTSTEKAQFMRFGPVQLFNNFSDKQKFRTLQTLDEQQQCLVDNLWNTKPEYKTRVINGLVFYLVEQNKAKPRITNKTQSDTSFYIVTQNHKSGIYTEWEDVKTVTQGSENPVFKKVRSFEEATEFLRVRGIFNYYVHPKCREIQNQTIKPEVLEGFKKLAIKAETKKPENSQTSPNTSYQVKYQLFEQIQRDLNEILKEELTIPGVTIHHETHYICPPIKCLNSSPQCKNKNNRPESGCPCNTRYSIYRMVIDMKDFGEFQYDKGSPVIDLSTASNMEIIKKIYVQNQEQLDEFPPFLKELMTKLYQEKEGIYVLEFEAIPFDEMNPTRTIIYISRIDKIPNETEMQYQWECGIPYKSQIKQYRMKMYAYECYIGLYQDFNLYTEKGNFKVFINPEIRFKHQGFQVISYPEDEEMILEYRREAKRSLTEMEEDEEQEEETVK